MSKNLKDRYKKTGDHGQSLHHVIPTSRGGRDVRENRMWKNHKVHTDWHHVWVNMTPTEIQCRVDALIRIFGDVRLSELKTLIETEWT